MVANPQLEEFRRRLEELRTHPSLRQLVRGDEVQFGALPLDAIAELLKGDKNKTAYYFLIAAASLNRTSLKKAVNAPEVQIVPKKLRVAEAIKRHLPVRFSFDATVAKAVALRSGDLGRRDRGSIEQLFRDRLKEDAIPILMSPPYRFVPALLVDRRKPDGVFPDPDAGLAPQIYLEVKNVQRVRDDIQKRLYEIAEAAIEMKLIYGKLKLTGLGLSSTTDVTGNAKLRAKIRKQITSATPVVVALLLCSKSEAEKYRAGAETFIDRVFFQEEIDECLAFLRETTVELGEG